MYVLCVLLVLSIFTISSLASTTLVAYNNDYTNFQFSVTFLLSMILNFAVYNFLRKFSKPHIINNKVKIDKYYVVRYVMSNCIDVVSVVFDT